MAVENFIASLVMRPSSKRPLLEELAALTPKTVHDLRPPRIHLIKAEAWLRQQGFRIVAKTPVGLSFSGPRDHLERSFPPIAHGGQSRTDLTVPAALEALVEKVQLAVPGRPFHSAAPPNPTFYHLDVDTGVPARLSATSLHAAGITGAGVRVSMVDTGFYTRVEETDAVVSANRWQLTVAHPAVDVEWVHYGISSDNYYVGGGFNGSLITLGTQLPGTTETVRVRYSCIHPFFESHGYQLGTVLSVDPASLYSDDEGHGTAQAASFFGMAPGAVLSFVKYCTSPLAAFQMAVEQQSPQIITCAFGLAGDTTPLLAEIASAVSDGIVVVFAAGEGGTDSPTAQVRSVASPDAISAGGAYPVEAGGQRASNLASSFDSFVHLAPQRHVPDVCGLAGEQAHPDLILAPAQPLSPFDADGDGWIFTSGTSSATSQTAGAAALLLQKYPTISPAAVKNILENSATDVDSGTSACLENAAPGWDPATGFGLLHAEAAANHLIDSQFVPYIRDSVLDNGSEPSAGPGNLWASPDILVRQAAITNPDVDLGPTVKHRLDLCDTVEDGQSNYVYLRVQNRGAQAGSCNATVYFTSPGMLHVPSAWTKINDTPFPITNLAPGELRVAGPIEWVDSKIPAVPGGVGHYCMIAILDHPSSPDLTQIQTIDDFVSLVSGKRNVAWRNIQIVDVVPGAPTKFDFFAQGPTDPRSRVSLHVDLGRIPVKAKVLIEAPRRIVKAARLDELIVADRTGAHTILACKGARSTIRDLTFAPRERARFTVRLGLPEDVPDGDHVIALTLDIDGKSAGGYTFVARISRAAWVGDSRTRKVHRRSCVWLARTATYARRPFGDLDQAHAAGFGDCPFCLGGPHQ